jgi:amino-acid N-acetyltransferase
MSHPTITPIHDGELAAVTALLAASSLPTAGLADRGVDLQVARVDGRIVGCVALETYADGALLRSLAVAPEWRGRGLGVRLTDTALERAHAAGHPGVFLLTETAEAFFVARGFRTVARDEVPAGVRGSIEFREACPASATAMARALP